MNEKDCTDKLTECHVSCDTDDKECISECIEEYHKCDTKEFTAEDVEQCIIDTNGDYAKCVDRMVETMKSPVELENVTDEWYDVEGNLKQ